MLSLHLRSIKTSQGNPTSTPSDPYPGPDNPYSEAIISDDVVINGTPFPYPPPEPEVVPIATPATSYPYHSYLPLILKPAIVYNRANAVSWADQWAHGRPSCFPNYGTGSNCDDCTNYLSQVLYKGGLPKLIEPEWDTGAWWYWCDDFCVCTNSRTWSTTNWMNTHVSQFLGIRYDYKTSAYDLGAGDFMILDLYTSPYHGIPNHARIIVGWGYPQEGDMFGNYLLLANQHCTDRYRVRWNYNLTGNDLVWYWHVRDIPSQ